MSDFSELKTNTVVGKLMSEPQRASLFRSFRNSSTVRSPARQTLESDFRLKLQLRVFTLWLYYSSFAQFTLISYWASMQPLSSSTVPTKRVWTAGGRSFCAWDDHIKDVLSLWHHIEQKAEKRSLADCFSVHWCHFLKLWPCLVWTSTSEAGDK